MSSSASSLPHQQATPTPTRKPVPSTIPRGMPSTGMAASVIRRSVGPIAASGNAHQVPMSWAAGMVMRRVVIAQAVGRAVTTLALATASITHPYHIVDESPWPIYGSLAGIFFTTGILS